jgi:hypothetical protein
MSPRTAKYVEALTREGDNFDYFRWLKRTREEEAQAKQAEAASPSGELVAAEIGKPLGPSDNQHMRPNPALPLLPKTIPVPTALCRPHRRAKSQTTKARLTRWLEEVRVAWEDFQASRARCGVRLPGSGLRNR